MKDAGFAIMLGRDSAVVLESTRCQIGFEVFLGVGDMCKRQGECDSLNGRSETTCLVRCL